MELILGIAAGVVVTLTAVFFGKSLWQWFTNKTKLIQSYWIFVFVFIAACSLAYFLTFTLSPVSSLSINLDILNTWSAIIFAVFVGYFAFAQLMESRLDNFIEKGFDAVEKAKSDYDTAIKYYELAHKSSPKDYRALSELTELYVVTEQFDKASAKLHLLKKVTAKSPKNITYHFLFAANEIVRGHLNEATRAIKETVDYTQANPQFLDSHVWSYHTVKESPMFNKLTGDRKALLSNLVRYLSKTLEIEESGKFTAGDYLLGQESTQDHKATGS